MTGISIKVLIEAGLTVIDLASQYKGEPKREMGVDGLLFGVLYCMAGVNQRQFKVYQRGRQRALRIDFAKGWNSPSSVIEFACRTKGRNEHYGSQNEDELRKLARRIRPNTRFLLLLDMSKNRPTPMDSLKATYDGINAGRGRFHRRSVRVIYVHPDEQYHFLWQPWA